MGDNLRETFRIEADSDLEAELFHEGRMKPCAIENLSAGGAKVTSAVSIPEGARCTLGVRLGHGLRPATAPEPYVRFEMEVLESTPRSDHSFDYRLRSTMEPGSPAYEAAQKLVFAAQRAALAKRTGASQASPMVTDEERHKRIRAEKKPRFSRGSTRPGAD